MNTVFVNIPCPTKEEAEKLCRKLLEQDLCGTAKIHENVYLMYKDDKGLQGEGIVLMSLKTTDTNMEAIHKFMLENHSWGTPCIEVLPVANDLC